MNHPVPLSTLAYVANNVANFVGNVPYQAQILMARALGLLNSFRMALPVTNHVEVWRLLAYFILQTLFHYSLSLGRSVGRML